jgi:hypothetical protein
MLTPKTYSGFLKFADLLHLSGTFDSIIAMLRTGKKIGEPVISSPTEFWEGLQVENVPQLLDH